MAGYYYYNDRKWITTLHYFGSKYIRFQKTVFYRSNYIVDFIMGCSFVVIVEKMLYYCNLVDVVILHVCFGIFLYCDGGVRLGIRVNLLFDFIFLSRTKFYFSIFSTLYCRVGSILLFHLFYFTLPSRINFTFPFV